MWEAKMLELSAIWTPATQQLLFRGLLNAMSRPGSQSDIFSLLEEGPVELAVLAVLVDAEVSLADPHQLLRENDWPLLQAAKRSPDKADYILCNGNVAPDFSPKLGTLTSPEQSATLIISVAELNEGSTHLKLSGPGISGATTLSVDGLSLAWLQAREDWICDFPLGVDLILVAARQLVAIPRTTKVEVL
jgi:alpha-D-ribose 1-methylphosphonate 5-triphosphate synthase subunit PhnH